ncbi:MAG: hypothetical protein GY749_24595 [Desulfobacteraceae bacterium]|nr:hypothetical protein [Desulfobacteraceae bacterium]
MHPTEFDADYGNFAKAVSFCIRSFEEQEKYTEEQVIQIIEEERNQGKENETEEYQAAVAALISRGAEE